MDVGQEPGSEHPLAGLAVIVVGLGMIQVDLGRGGRGHVRCQERLGILDREPDVVQPPLVGPPGRVADHHREQVDREVVVIGPGQALSERVSAIAAAQVDHHRRSRPKIAAQSSGPGGGNASWPSAPTPARAGSRRGWARRIRARCLQEARATAFFVLRSLDRVPFGIASSRIEKSYPAGGTNVILL